MRNDLPSPETIAKFIKPVVVNEVNWREKYKIPLAHESSIESNTREYNRLYSKLRRKKLIESGLTSAGTPRKVFATSGMTKEQREEYWKNYRKEYNRGRKKSLKWCRHCKKMTTHSTDEHPKQQ